MANKTGLVFLHGAGLGSHIWDDIKPIINRNALYIDFPNRGGASNSNNNLRIEDYFDSVVQQIKAWSNNAFVIVAHSISGGLGLMLSDHFGEKVKGFIAIGAAIPASGKSFISCLPFPQKYVLPMILKLFGTQPPKKTIAYELCNDLSEKQTELIVNQIAPESRQLFTSNVHYQSNTVKTLYVKLTNDKALSVTIQDNMISNLRPDKVVMLESGHLPMISQPEELTEIIHNFMETNIFN